MAATNPMRVKDLLHKYGWDFIPRLAALGIQFQGEAQILFVDSGATNALDADDGVHGHSFVNPLATIDYAIGLCTAGQDDVILVAAGHTEAISAAAGIDLDVDGVTIVGLGVNDRRPKISFTDTASTFEINADNVTIKNLQFVGAKTGGTTVGIDIKEGSNYVTIEGCKFYETANTKEILTAITAEDKTNYLAIRNCEFLTLAGGDSVAALVTEADEHAFLVVEGCTFIGDWSASCLDLDAGAIVLPLIRNCTMVNVDATAGKVITIAATTVATMVDLRVATGKGNAYPVATVTASYEVGCHACEAGAVSYAGMGSKTVTDFAA